MTTQDQLLDQTRQALAQENGPQLQQLCKQWLSRFPQAPDGHYVAGVLAGQAEKFALAAKAFERALQLDQNRCDAAIQLARCLVRTGDHARACQLVRLAAEDIRGKPWLQDLAGSVLTHIGCHAEALPLYRAAVGAVPGHPEYLSNLSACALFNGETILAKEALEALLALSPDHPRAWWQYSRLSGIDRRAAIRLVSDRLPRWQGPLNQAYGHYALAKWYEDEQDWPRAANTYQRAAEAAQAVVPPYSGADEKLTVDALIRGFDADWWQKTPAAAPAGNSEGTEPLFIVGLPRTGSTLIDSILSAHSSVTSAGELQFVGLVTKQLTGLKAAQALNPAIAAASAGIDPAALAQGYWQASAYLGLPGGLRTDKLPGNFYYLGLLAKAFPHGRFVHVLRDPMDACFAIYKQLFAGAYPFSYDLDALADYYLGYHRLMAHWRSLLGDRLVEVKYEDLVADPHQQVPQLLQRLGLSMEPDCLAYYQQKQTVATASAAQVREKPHIRSIGRWRHFETLMAPVAEKLRVL